MAEGIYRKKAVNVEAWRVASSTNPPGWVVRAVHDEVIVGATYSATAGLKFHDSGFDVKTKEGVLQAHPGDWLIRAKDGRIWPTDDAYFSENYEGAD